jgi:hypothetical protein
MVSVLQSGPVGGEGLARWTVCPRIGGLMLGGLAGLSLNNDNHVCVQCIWAPFCAFGSGLGDARWAYLISERVNKSPQPGLRKLLL